MREAKLVSVILVVSLLLFGCGAKASTNVSANASVNGSNVPPSGTQPPPPPPPPPQTPPSGGTTNGSVSGGTGGSGNGGSGSGYSGMEFGALMALGVPLECDVTSTTNGTTTTSKMFIKGSTKMRIESPTNNADGCQTIVILPKDQKMYMGCKEGPFMAQCDWLLFELSAGSNGTMTGQVSTTGGSSIDTDFSDVSPSQINCKAWVYDEAMFEADGDICDMSSMGG